MTMKSATGLGLALMCMTALAQCHSFEEIFSWLEANREEAKNELIELASIPSVSAVPSYSESCLKAAQWLEKRARKAGLENVAVLPTEAKTHQPVVYGDWLHAPGRPTLLIYGHYDVQPAEDIELWNYPPFEAHFKDGYFHGRGVDDDKGGIVPVLQVLEAYLQTSKALPLNVKILFEGQEEYGSPNLASFLKKHRNLLKADFCVSADGGQDSPTQGILALGLRGNSGFEVTVRALKQDAHSGTFGGSVPNANIALAKLLAGLHFPNNSVAIPGFYNKVREITDDDRADMAAYTSFSLEEHLKRAGATEPVGEEGFTTLERVWHRPTCEVVGQYGGFTGEGIKTIVPAKAVAKIACRLVPDQDPEEVIQLAKSYVETFQMPGVTLTFAPLTWVAPPYELSKDSLLIRAATEVLQQLIGKPPIFFRVGGSIPAAAFLKKELGIEFLFFGFGLPGNNIHGPNERFGLAEFLRTQDAYVRILSELSTGAEGERHEEL